MAAKKLKPIGNISIVTGTYQKDGEAKNRYLQIGTLFKRIEGPGLTIKLDAYPPTNADGQIWLSVYPIHRKDDPEGSQENPDDDGGNSLDDNINLDSDIPF